MLAIVCLSVCLCAVYLSLTDLSTSKFIMAASCDERFLANKYDDDDDIYYISKDPITP